MKRLWLVGFGIVACGCAGSSNEFAGSRFPGTYDGTWESLTDSSDNGTSAWTIHADGTVAGTDFDPGRNTTFAVSGRIDAAGNLTTTSTPANGDPAASLNGRLTFNDVGQATGVLVWGVNPPLSYRYTFTKR